MKLCEKFLINLLHCRVSNQVCGIQDESTDLINWTWPSWCFRDGRSDTI